MKLTIKFDVLDDNAIKFLRERLNDCEAEFSTTKDGTTLEAECYIQKAVQVICLASYYKYSEILLRR